MPSTAETAGGGELASAQESLQEAEKGGGLAHQTSMQSLLQVCAVMMSLLAVLTAALLTTEDAP